MRFLWILFSTALWTPLLAEPVRVGGGWEFFWEAAGAHSDQERILAGDADFRAADRPSQLPNRSGNIVWLRHSFDAAAGRTIYIANVSQLVEVYANGRRIYAHGTISPGERLTYLGNPFHMIDLPEHFSGPVYFRVYSSGEVIGLCGAISQGERSDHIIALFHADLARLILGSSFMLLAMAALLLGLVDRGLAHVAFAFFSFSVGLFVVTTTRIKHLTPVDPLVWSYINVASIACTPLSFALFTRTIFRLTGLWRRLVDGSAWLVGLLLTAGVLLSALRYTQIIDFLAPFNGGSLAAGLICFAAVIREAWRGSKDARIMLWGAAFMSLAAAHDIALESLGWFSSTGIWLHWGMLILILTLAYTVRERYVAFYGRYQKVSAELDLAKKIQASLLPASTPVEDRCSISVLFSPADTVGGDLYEFHQVRGKSVSFFLGDVSGHGVPAAILSSMVKAAVSIQFSEGRLSPRLFLSSVNEFLCRQLKGNFVTAFYGHLDLVNMKMAFATAGHPAAFFWNSEGTEVRRLRTRGKMLGLFPDLVFEEEILPITAGDRILVPTDGILECEDARRRLFDDEGVASVIARAWKDPQLLVRLEDALRDFGGLHHVDDQTALLVELRQPVKE